MAVGLDDGTIRLIPTTKKDFFQIACQTLPAPRDLQEHLDNDSDPSGLLRKKMNDLEDICRPYRAFSAPEH